jgi:pimeloyl-ACP methyl ester carboxylesterase
MTTSRPEPPSAWATAGEALSGLQAIRLIGQTPRLARTPRGHGAPVILTPGLGASDVSLLPLRRFLRDRGYHARSAGLGRIGGNVPELAAQLLARTIVVHRQTGHKVTLIGWSMGGILSREVARERPELVERIITFGTPVTGGPAHTAFGRGLTDADRALIDERIEHRSQVAIRVPITAIWSRRDGVVAPAACIDRRSPQVEHVEVSSTHLGMGIDPDVWRIIADRLGEIA